MLTVVFVSVYEALSHGSVTSIKMSSLNFKLGCSVGHGRLSGELIFTSVLSLLSSQVVRPPDM